MPLAIKVNSDINFKHYQAILQKLGNINQFDIVNEKITGAVSFLSGKDEFYITLSGSIDVDAEKDRILKEIEYLEGFLKAVNSKLSNEKFVVNAKPDIVANEKNKQADAEAKLKTFQETLSSL